MARSTLVAPFFALFLLLAGCGQQDDDDSSSPTPACEMTDEVTGNWWRVWLEACGTSATVFVETHPTDGSASESAQAAFLANACTGASSQEWNSTLITSTGYPGLEVDFLQLYNAVEVDVTDNITPDYDGFSESFYDVCPTPNPRP